MATRRDFVAAASLSLTGSVMADAAQSRNAACYIHLFVFRLKSGVTDVQQDRIVAAVQGLQGEIPGLIETWAGKNISSRGQGYTIGGAMKFADRASYENYPNQPSHKALLTWLLPLIDPVEVDFAAPVKG